MARIIAIANQKGGVGKTTTAVNLAASLAIAERRTLLMDADPQGNATSGIGLEKAAVGLSLYDVIIDRVNPADVIVHHDALPHLDVLPATQDLVGAELELVQTPRRESALRDALVAIHDTYEYIIVDCPPSLGLITLNVLTAAQGVIIPIQCEYYALEGISQLLNTVRLVQQNFNTALAIDGVLLTMYDARLNLCRQVAEDAKEYFGQQMFRTAIPRNVRLAEAPSFGKPILLYDVQSVGARSYLAVAQELLRRTGNAPEADTVSSGGSAGNERPADVESASATEGTQPDATAKDAAAGTMESPSEAGLGSETTDEAIATGEVARAVLAEIVAVFGDDTRAESDSEDSSDSRRRDDLDASEARADSVDSTGSVDSTDPADSVDSDSTREVPS